MNRMINAFVKVYLSLILTICCLAENSIVFAESSSAQNESGIDYILSGDGINIQNCTNQHPRTEAERSA